MGLAYSYNQTSIMPLTQFIHNKNKKKLLCKNNNTNYLIRYYIINELTNKSTLNDHNISGYTRNNWRLQSIDNIFNKF